jgi:glycosyltransferase involved in cell wall biosynthesis
LIDQTTQPALREAILSTTISVITPSFNQAPFLARTIRSVISQRPFVDQYIVMDGGSADGSVDIIRAHEAGVDAWVSQRDGGQADAIHQGFSRARGDVIGWLNSDDILLPGALRSVRAAFDAHPHWDALSGYSVHIDRDSRLVSCHRIPGEGAARARWGIHHVTQPTCFFRRRLYDRIGGINLNLHCVLDTELWLRMFDGGAVWGHIPRYLAAFRVHDRAKGSDSAWARRYAAEEEELRHSFARYNAPSFKHQVGLTIYRTMQVLSGRALAAAHDARRWRGRSIDDIFRPTGAAAIAPPKSFASSPSSPSPSGLIDSPDSSQNV